MAVDTQNMEGMERLFWEQMNALGATMESFKRTSPREWYPDKFVYKITKADNSVVIGELPWDLEMYPTLIKIAGGNV